MCSPIVTQPAEIIVKGNAIDHYAAIATYILNMYTYVLTFKAIRTNSRLEVQLTFYLSLVKKMVARVHGSAYISF